MDTIHEGAALLVLSLLLLLFFYLSLFIIIYLLLLLLFLDVLCFDNSYSWVRQKEVYYFVHIDEPDDDGNIVLSPSNNTQTSNSMGLEPST